jgi:conjugative transfer signal peptidase TraF
MSRERPLLSDVLRLVAYTLRSRKRLGILSAAVAGIALVTAPSLGFAPRLVWNASASAPLGLYWVVGKTDLRRGDVVLAQLPEPMQKLASERGYLPFGTPLIKHIAALPGDHLCTIGRAILIGGTVAARRLKRDSTGRLMPAWSGCRLLVANEIFVLNADVLDSFDGRYFGPTSMDEIIGRLIPLWAWPAAQP